MKEAVYIETTIPSYYVARPSKNVVQLARQQLTKEWWNLHRHQFDLFTSQIVLDEAGEGEAFKAAERIALLANIPLLDIDDLVESLAEELVRRGILPALAADDALHIACSAAHAMSYLLTWNCKHIANPRIQDRIRACFSKHRVKLPVICTPEEFIGDDDHA